MKVEITYSLPSHKEVIDLEDYEHDPETLWQDLTEDEQHKIEDELREDIIIGVSATDLK